MNCFAFHMRTPHSQGMTFVWILSHLRKVQLFS